MRQVADANWKVPYIGGWCLGYVEMAWGLATMHQNENGEWYTVGKYNSATDAWNNAQGKHYDIPPLGITVPVYFSLGSTSDGHIAIRLSDGTVASSTLPGKNEIGYIHPSLDAMISVYARYNNGCTYRGWSEELAGTIIVKEDDMIPSEEFLNALFIAFRGRKADQYEVERYVGKVTYNQLIPTLNTGDERKLLDDETKLGKIALKDNWRKQIEDLLVSNKELQKKLVEAQNGESVKKLEQIKAIANS